MWNWRTVGFCRLYIFGKPVGSRNLCGRINHSRNFDGNGCRRIRLRG